MKQFLSVMFCMFTFISSAQYFGVKTNVLYDASSTINLGMEIGMGKKTTLDISGNYNPWDFGNNKKIQHWMVQPEFRLWTCEKFNGHFFGIHAHGGQGEMANVELPFDLYQGLKDHEYRGMFYGGGLSYGYHWILGKRWGLEASLGVGYARMEYDVYSCDGKQSISKDLVKNYFGPTKAAISLVYIIR